MQGRDLNGSSQLLSERRGRDGQLCAIRRAAHGYRTLGGTDAVHMLETFMNIGPASDRELAWSVAILLTFVLSALLLAVMNGISPGEHQ